MTFTTDPRPKWRRTMWAKSPAGYSVEVDAPRSKTPFWRRCEARVLRDLAREGYTTTRSHLSRGAADIIATCETDTLHVQVKSVATFRPSSFNAGVREILALRTGDRRQMRGFVQGKGHVVTVEIAPDWPGGFVVSGKEPYRSAVAEALKRMQKP